MTFRVRYIFFKENWQIRKELKAYILEIYCEQLVHMIMEAEKSYGLLSTSWRPRSQSMLQSESKGLRTTRPNGVSFSIRTREDVMTCPAVRQEKSGEFLFLMPFILFRCSIDWMTLIYIRENNLLSPEIQMLTLSRNPYRHTQK